MPRIGRPTKEAKAAPPAAKALLEADGRVATIAYDDPPQTTPCKPAGTAEAAAAEANQWLGEYRGRNQAVQLLEKVVSVADIVQLAKVRRLKLYKGVVYRDDTGAAKRIDTWAEYCRLAVGRSRETIDTAIANLDALGADVVDYCEQRHFPIRTIRAIRTSDEAMRQRIATAVRAGSQDQIDAAIQEALRAKDQQRVESEERAAAEIANLKAERERLEVDVADRERDLKRETARARDLEKKNEKLSNPLPTEQQGQMNHLADVTRQYTFAVQHAVNAIDAVMEKPASRACDTSARAALDYMAQVLRDEADKRGITLNLDAVAPAHMGLTTLPTAAAAPKRA